MTRIRRRPVAVIAAGALALTGVVAISGATAALSGSSFEIDGNLVQESGLDWLGSAVVSDGSVQRDALTGRDDNSYSGGVKEDTVCPTETTGSIPNNKSDLKTFRVYEEEGDAGHPGYLNIAWSRVAEPSGTTLMDFEFNQSKTGCATGPNRVRTTGDFLIEYLIDQGGSRADITLRRWDATAGAWGAPTDLDVNSPTCGNGPCAEGTINTAPILAADSGEDPGVDMEARTFGEASIDLRVIFQPGRCESFGSAMLKSRSSDSFTSQLKDFIAPVDITLTNCGTVIIRKETLPDGEPGSFDFTKAFGTDPTSVNTFSLGDGGSTTYNNVLFGSGYTVEETGMPDGFSFVGVECGAGSVGVVPTSVVGSRVTFAIDDADDVLDCTYTNQAKATFTVKKVIDPASSAAEFTFVPGSGLPAGDLLLGHDETHQYVDLPPGDVTITETVPGTGWDLTDVTCVNGDGATVYEDSTSPPAQTTVSLAAGDDVTCTYTNVERATLRIIKTDDADPAAPLAGAGFTAYLDQVEKGSCTTALGDHDGLPGTPEVAFCEIGNLVPDVEYSVQETTTPEGYETAAAQLATPGPGATVELTFVDQRLFTIVTFVCSNWDNKLYESEVTFDTEPTLPSDSALPDNSGGEPYSLTQEQLCELLTSKYGEAAAGEHSVDVNIE